jgi:hypothetical protein
VALLSLLLGVLVACGGDDEQRGPSGTGGDRAAGAWNPARIRAAEQRVLDQRARAVRTRDLELFLAHVDRRDRALVARQRRYFENLVQLPLDVLRYRVLEDSWGGLRIPRRWGRRVHVPRVRLVMQLDGYDALPVRRTVGFAFALRRGRVVIVSDRTPSGEPLFEGTPAPWDLTAVTVREDLGVLGVFDERTRASAEEVVAVVREGVEQVQEALPFDWDPQVVVYSVQTPRVLASFTDVPGGTIDHLGALTFPIYATERRRRVASTRMLVMPSSVQAGQPFLGRITRHELSHIGIGSRDDGVPVWVSEGLAEYLGAHEIPLRERIIPSAAVDRARVEDSGMPESRSFNDTDQEWHYALSWMACDYIASAAGEDRLWELVDAMHNDGAGTSDAEQDRVLDQVLGYDSRELARRATARIRNLYG